MLTLGIIIGFCARELWHQYRTSALVPRRAALLAAYGDAARHAADRRAAYMAAETRVSLFSALEYAQGEACGGCGECLICTTLDDARGE